MKRVCTKLQEIYTHPNGVIQPHPLPSNRDSTDNDSTDFILPSCKISIDCTYCLGYLIAKPTEQGRKQQMFHCFRRRGSKCCSQLRGLNNEPLPLSNAPVGCRIRVAGINGGRRLCARMAAMGIYPGVEMELLCAACGCPCLIKLRGGTLSLGAGVSEKILVTSAA